MGYLYNAAPNFTVRILQFNAFLCPSDTNIPNGSTTVGNMTGQPGYHSYPNNIGTFGGTTATRSTARPTR